MVKIILVVVGVVLMTVATIAIVNIGPRNLVGMMRYDRRREGTLKVGDRASDVTLHRLDGSSRATLLQFVGGRPLVLVFGSFT